MNKDMLLIKIFSILNTESVQSGEDHSEEYIKGYSDAMEDIQWSIDMETLNKGLQDGQKFVSSRSIKDSKIAMLTPQALADLMLEHQILASLPEDYNWMAREKGGELYVYKTQPDYLVRKSDSFWWDGNEDLRLPLDHLFQNVQWYDRSCWNFREMHNEG